MNAGMGEAPPHRWFLLTGAGGVGCGSPRSVGRYVSRGIDSGMPGSGIAGERPGIWR